MSKNQEKMETRIMQDLNMKFYSELSDKSTGDKTSKAEYTDKKIIPSNFVKSKKQIFEISDSNGLCKDQKSMSVGNQKMTSISRKTISRLSKDHFLEKLLIDQSDNVKFFIFQVFEFISCWEEIFDC